MSTVYVETSAVLAWLLGEPGADDVRSAVDAATRVVTSSLTVTETERALVRAEHGKVVTAGDAQRLRGLLHRAKLAWMTMGLSSEVLTRAGQPFPVEPVRTLDAIHLATALAFTKAYPDLHILTLDHRIANNAQPLGLA